MLVFIRNSTHFLAFAHHQTVLNRLKLCCLRQHSSRCLLDLVLAVCFHAGWTRKSYQSVRRTGCINGNVTKHMQTEAYAVANSYQATIFHRVCMPKVRLAKGRHLGGFAFHCCTETQPALVSLCELHPSPPWLDLFVESSSY